MDILGPAAGIVGIITFLAGVVVALSNRQVRQERIDHLEGINDTLREELAAERDSCTRRVDALTTRVAHLQGQLDAVTGELGEKLGASIATAVIERVAGDERLRG